MKNTGMNNSGENRSQGYSSLVEQHFAQPQHAGTLTGHFETTLSGGAGQREHGTEIVFHIGLNDDRIGEITFQAFGCPHTIAACSVLAERLTGCPIESLGDIRPDELAACMDLPVENTGRLLVIEDALSKCSTAWDNRRLGRR
jgi:NifU-like protein involved in Fe-S cluster formation